MKKIVMTGGGTAGHVTPNIALMPSLKEAGFDVEVIDGDKYPENILPVTGPSQYDINRLFVCREAKR